VFGCERTYRHLVFGKRDRLNKCEIKDMEICVDTKFKMNVRKVVCEAGK
jgi:hypothetical protein